MIAPLRRILSLWRGRLLLLMLGGVASVATLATGVALMFYSGGLLAGVLAGGAAILIGAPLLLRVLGPLRVVLRYVERMLTHDATFRALADLRVWFFRGLAERSAGGLGFRRSGDVLARLVNDIEALDGLYLRILVPLAGAVALLPVIVFVLVPADPALAAAVTALFALSAFALPLFAARAAASGGATLAGADAALRIAALDAIGGAREIRAFEAEGRIVAAMQAREGALFSAQRAQMSAGALAGAGAFLCAQAALFAVLIWAHDAIAAALVFLTVAVFEAIGLLPRAGVLAGRAVAAARRVLEVVEGPLELPDPGTPAAPPTGSALKFEGVHFRWRPDTPLVFDGLTLDVPQGSRVALLGPSGAGKSTLAALALKVVAPQRGRVLLGGVDIATLSAADVRARIGWLSQATHLFEDSIRANLLLAAPEASDAALWEALDAARIGDMVRALPDGLDAWVGEGGVGFSGGQGRRLALARALLSPAPVLILDEPCAGLDADTEREFFATLNETARGRTIVLIAHRLTGVERLDRIWRVSGGHAVAAAA
jgi:ATP-binding cassette subfamily C protein CydC